MVVVVIIYSFINMTNIKISFRSTVYKSQLIQEKVQINTYKNPVLHAKLRGEGRIFSQVLLG